MRRIYQFIAFYSILFGLFISYFTGTTILPGFSAQMLALSGYLVAIIFSHRIIVLPKNNHRTLLLVLIALVFFPALIGTFLEFSLLSLIRMLMFAFSIYVFFVLFPNFVSFRHFAAITVTFASISTLFAITSVFFGEYRLLFLEINSVAGSGRISYLGLDIPEIRGIYNSPNRFGFLTATGAFLSLYFIDVRDFKNSVIPTSLFLVNLTGLLLSGSRSSYIGLTVAVGFLLIFVLYKTTGLKIAVLSMTFSAVGIFLAILGFLPGWNGLHPSSLTHRVGIWEAAVSATLQRPLTGWGFVPTSDSIGPYLPEYLSGTYSTHNSYLRIFVSGGLISGIAYILFITVICYWGSNVRNRQDLFALCTAMLLLTIHIFEIPTIFGFSMPSTLAGVSLGYIYFNNVDSIKLRHEYNRE